VALKLENQQLRPCGWDNLVSLTGLSAANGNDAERRIVGGRSATHYFVSLQNCQAVWSHESVGGNSNGRMLFPVDASPSMFHVGFFSAAEDSSWFMGDDEDKADFDDYDEYYTDDEDENFGGSYGNFHTSFGEAHVSFDFSYAMNRYVANATEPHGIGSNDTTQEMVGSCNINTIDDKIDHNYHESKKPKWAAKYSSIKDPELSALFISIQKESRTIDITLMCLQGMMIIFVPLLAWIMWRVVAVSSANFREKATNVSVVGYRISRDGSSTLANSLRSQFDVVGIRGNSKEVASKQDELPSCLPQCLGPIGEMVRNGAKQLRQSKSQIMPTISPLVQRSKLPDANRSSENSPLRKASMEFHCNKNSSPASPRHWYDEYLSPQTLNFKNDEVNISSMSTLDGDGVDDVSKPLFTAPATNSKCKESRFFGGRNAHSTNQVIKNDDKKTSFSFAPKPPFSNQMNANKNLDPLVSVTAVAEKTGSGPPFEKKNSFVQITEPGNPQPQSKHSIPLQQSGPAAKGKDNSVKTFSFATKIHAPKINSVPSSSLHTQNSTPLVTTLAKKPNSAGSKFSFARNLMEKQQSQGKGSTPSYTNATTFKSDKSIEKFSFTKKDSVSKEDTANDTAVNKDVAVNGKENAFTVKNACIAKSQPENTPVKSSFSPSPRSVSFLKLSNDLEESASLTPEADEFVNPEEAEAPFTPPLANGEKGCIETDTGVDSGSPVSRPDPKSRFPATVVDLPHHLQRADRKFDCASASCHVSPLESPSRNGNDSVSSSRSFDNELKLKVKSRMSRANSKVAQDPPNRRNNEVPLPLESASTGEMEIASNQSSVSSEPSTPCTSEDGEDRDSAEAQSETREIEESESSSLSEYEVDAKQKEHEEQEDTISNESSEDDTAAKAAKSERAFHDLKRNVIIELQAKTKDRSTYFGARQKSSAEKENRVDNGDSQLEGTGIGGFAEELAITASKKQTNETKSSRKILVPVEQVTGSVEGSPTTSLIEDDSFLADYW